MPRKSKQPSCPYGVHPSVAMMQKWVETLKDKTGRSLDEWLAFVKANGPDDEKARREWLKKQYGLGTNTAWWIAERAAGRGWVDSDGYFWHGGRADDVIISAGWTIGAVEVEDALLKHPAVREAAVIGVPDELRGQVVKAFIVAAQEPSEALTKEIQDFVRARLSQHEYPRIIDFVTDLPKTPAGKVNRKVLRDREAAGGPPGRVIRPGGT